MWGSLIPSLVQGAVGLAQGIGGALAQANRPKYEIPQAIKDMYTGAKGLASQTRLPGQDILESQIDEGMGGMVKNIEKISGGNPASLGALGDIYANSINAKKGLAVDAARYHASNQSQLRQAQQIMGQYQNQQFDYNQNQPYQQAAATKSSLIGAGISNVMAGAGNVAGTLSYQDLIKKMFGNNGGDYQSKTTDTAFTGSGPTNPEAMMGGNVTNTGGANGFVPPFGGNGVSPMITNPWWQTSPNPYYLGPGQPYITSE